MDAQKSLVIVTGLSGAGKSVVINALEDMGVQCIDNLPLDLFEPAKQLILKSEHQHQFAWGIDAREVQIAKQLHDIIPKLKVELDVDVVYLTADDEVLLERYRTTRRKHPLMDVGGELLAAIRRERAQVEAIRKLASWEVDTSQISPHYLGRMVENRFAGATIRRKLYVTITSFGFKYGTIRPVDTLFDVRFMTNPYFIKELRDKTGLDPAVVDYVFKHDEANQFLDHTLNLLEFLLPKYYAEGKHYLRIGVGCTGGQHRSVATAEALGQRLAANDSLKNCAISVLHRDLAGFSLR